MTEPSGSDDAALESEIDETPTPLAPSGIWIRTRGGRRPLIRDWTGDLETDALHMAPDADLSAIAADDTNPLCEKAKIVKRENDERWEKIGKAISASQTPFSDILATKAFDVSSMLPKIDYSSFLPKIDYSPILSRIDLPSILPRGAVSPYLSRSVEASLRRAEGSSDSPADRIATESDDPEREGAVSLSEVMAPGTNELLANLLDAFHVQRAESSAQHAQSVVHLENQSKAMAAMADIARAQAKASEEDSKRAAADALWHRKSAKRSQNWTVFAALSAVIIGLLTLIVPMLVREPTHQVIIPSLPAEQDGLGEGPSRIEVPFAPGVDPLEGGNWTPSVDR